MSSGDDPRVTVRKDGVAVHARFISDHPEEMWRRHLGPHPNKKIDFVEVCATKDGAVVLGIHSPVVTEGVWMDRKTARKLIRDLLRALWNTHR